MTTKRRKIVRSVAIRRIKPRKSQIAKRLKLKTQKRKSRNTVMRGGSKKLTMYVIEKERENPKCVIIRQHEFPLDTIYLFFDANIEDDEITEFVSAATGLGLDDINLNMQRYSPKSEKTEKEKEKENGFKRLFVKLSGNIRYSLSTGLLVSSQHPYSEIELSTITSISTIPTTAATRTTDIKMKNGQEIIDSLQRTTNAKSGYSFTTSPVANISEDFGSHVLWTLSTIFVKKALEAKKKHCSVLLDSDKMTQLKELVDNQKKLNSIIYDRSVGFFREQSKEPIDEHKKTTVNTAKEYLVDISKAQQLIDEIKDDPLLSECKTLIDDTLLDYINKGSKAFTRDIDAIKIKVANDYSANS